MSSRRFRELQSLSADELKMKINEAEGELFQIKMKKSINEVKARTSTQKLRKDLARMKMLNHIHSSGNFGKSESKE